jgi:hypothetical protein
MHTKLKILTLGMFFILVTSCGNSDNKYDEFFSIYKDILIAREFTSDSLDANRKIDSILNSRNLSEPEFRKLTFEYIKDRKGFFEKLEKLRDSIRSMRDSLTGN